VRVIVDTNIFVSGLISDTGPPAQIVDAITKGTITPVMSPDTFAELEEVLHRPRLQCYFQHAEVTPFQFLSQLETLIDWVKPKPMHSQIAIRDKKDRPFILLAASRQPEFIITGDKNFEEDRYADVPVISASLFVQTVLALN